MSKDTRTSKHDPLAALVLALLAGEPGRVWRIDEVAAGLGVTRAAAYHVLYTRPGLFERLGTVGRYRLRVKKPK